MPTNYGKIAGHVPVTQRTHPAQVKNDDAGYVFRAPLMESLKRFLILGAEGATYYVTHAQHALRNVRVVRDALEQNPLQAIEMAHNVSVRGLAMKQDAALYVIAEALKHPDIDIRRKAAELSRDMTRTGSTFLTLIAYIGKERGIGKIVRGVISDWYNFREGDDLAFQVTKYANRAGWTHGDVLRRGHPRPVTAQHADIFSFLLHDAEKRGVWEGETSVAERLAAYNRLRGDISEKELIALIDRYNFPHDSIPTQKMTDKVWAFLLEKGMATTALIRNLGQLSAKGLMDDPALRFKALQTLSPERLVKGRVHPMTVFQALKTYAKGSGVRGAQTWQPHPRIVDALDEAFYDAFGSIEQRGMVIRVSLDHSQSMMQGNVLGMPDTTPAEASAAMAMVLAHQYPNATFTTFAAGCHETDIISRRRRLDDILAAMPRRGEMTDISCALDYHIRHNSGGAIVMLTDGQVNTGKHVYATLAELRRNRGDVKMVVAMTEANQVALTLDDDPLSLGIAGFDASVPQLLNGFIG